MMQSDQAAAWDAYFSHDSETLVDSSSLRAQLLELKGEVFSSTSELSVTDIVDGRPSTSIVRNEADLETLYHASPKRGVRIISICSERTTSPLKISAGLAADFFRKYRIRRAFVPVLLSFGKAPHQAEASAGFVSFQSADDESYDLCYKLNYVEKNRRSGRDPWSSRHLGIYHHHDSSGLSLFIFLICTRTTALFERLEDLTRSPPTSPKSTVLLQDHPASLHRLAFSCYVDNWRPYFRSLGSQFAKINNQAMVVTADQAKPQDSFDRVQSLRNIHDISLFANACCASNLEVSKTLRDAGILPVREALELKSLSGILEGNVASCRVLQEKIRNSIDLIGYTLTLRNQLETEQLDREIRDMTSRMQTLAQENRDMTAQMKSLAEETSVVTRKLQELTQHSVDDSAIVNIITIVSAVYLPGSFVASVFGMNFFAFDSNNRLIEFAPDFWIFVLVWVCLMGVTGGVFWFAWQLKKNNIMLPWTRPKPSPELTKV